MRQWQSTLEAERVTSPFIRLAASTVAAPEVATVVPRATTSDFYKKARYIWQHVYHNN